MALARQRGAAHAASSGSLSNAQPARQAAAHLLPRRGSCLGFALVGCCSIVLPLTLLALAYCQSPAACGRAPRASTWWQQANPFSLYTLCWIRSNIASIDEEGTPGGQGRNATVASNSSNATTATAGSGGSSAPPPPAGAAQPPPATAPQAGITQEEVWANRRAANRQRQRRVAGDAYDEVELPEDARDVERILSHPHYDECNACKVCVPLDVVRGHARAQAHPAVRKVHVFETLDEDVTVEVTPSMHSAAPAKAAGSHPAKSKHGGRRRLQQQSSWRQHFADAALPPRGDGGKGAAAWGRQPRAHGSTQGAKGLGRGSAGVAGGDAAGRVGRGSRRRRRQLQAAPASLSKGGKDESVSDSFFSVKGKLIDIRGIAPGDTKAGPRRALPNCTVCWGCTHTLEMMASGSVVAGSYYSHEPGGSPSWLFRVRSNRTRSGWAVVKTWCVPVRKAKQRGLAMCSPPKVFAQVKLLLAQNKVIRQCGLDGVVPTMWVEPVRGVIPGHGFRIDWLGLWADVADGVSVQNIHEFGKPRTPPPVLLDLLTRKVNRTELLMVAVFDVLTSQCDRHQQNLFLTETGKVWAIDNDQVYGVAWRKCGFDSMLLPTTQKHTINANGFFFVMKFPPKNPPKQPAPMLNPLLLLDYRCHAEGGALGTSFPGRLTQCMRHVGALTPSQIQIEYGYPSASMAQAIRNRSRDLVTKGFEWALLFSQPANQPQHRYKVAPACCGMRYEEKAKRYHCDTPWKQVADLPYGNPWHGGPWHGPPGKDTGTYNGSTLALF